MNLPSLQVALIIMAAIAVVAGVVYAERLVEPRYRVPYRIASAIAVAGGFFYGVQRLVPDFGVAVDVIKGVIAGIAALAVFYELRRKAMHRPVAERWKKVVGVALALAAFFAYFNGFRNGYDKGYHRHELYHYYLGAKYFHEMGYDALYRCTVVAQSELGVYTHVDEDTGKSFKIDMGKEVKHPDRKVRNLGQDNLLVPAKRFLENPDECKRGFTSPERWEAFKKDIAFFRAVSGQDYFNKMQGDHGFNPPPVWTIAGKVFSELVPATTKGMQTLAMLDMLLWFGMFAALWWAFGWRVSTVAAIFWGCQSSAPMLWTCGAFLRQDWLFFLVLSVCFVRKRYFALGAAALVYSAMLRIFPGLLVVGWLGVAGWQLVKHKRLTKPQLRMLAGGTLAAAVLIPASIYVCGKDAYPQFYVHTLKVHDQTPLTNHMGLRVLLAQKLPFELRLSDSLAIGVGKDSGRMKYSENKALSDPFDDWKRMRNERYAKLKPVAYAIIALTMALFLYVLRRMKNMWLALCLSQVFVILMSQLTCYYYSFMILSAPIARVKPLRHPVELSLFGFAIVSQVGWRVFRFNDDKYWILTLISLIFCYGLIVVFAPPPFKAWFRERLPFLFPGSAKPAPAKATPQQAQ
jgi:hypothetical protein